MPLNLFYITNNLDVALIAEKYGVDRIWIDLETLGKEKRQKGDTVKSHHKISDISVIAPKLTKAEMLVRVNPWNKDSKDEIDAVINAGADIVMLPYWKTPDEVNNFLKAVNGRAKTTLLLETKEAVECVDDVLKFDFDEIHIGINDLHLSYGLNFMFELLADGTVEMLCKKFKKKGIPYGFGGIASIGEGTLESSKVIMEHYRLGSTRAILSRTFCNADRCDSLEQIDVAFKTQMAQLRNFELVCQKADKDAFESNKECVRKDIAKIVKNIVESKK